MRAGFTTTIAVLGAAAAHLATGTAAHAQAQATASIPIQISAFAGITGAYTGLGSRNLGITAGVDVGVRSFFGITPALELRGTYPVSDGQVVKEENVLGGVRLGKRYNRLRPYVDVLYGRGKQTYLNGGLANSSQTFVYDYVTSNVFSPGVGVDLDLTHHLGVKADFQLQRYGTPAVDSGAIYAKPLTLGIVYRLGF